MTLTQLKNFIAVVETGSFTRAAELNMTAQPAISYSIRTLEDEMGGSLLVRSTRTVQTTEAGKWFYDEARELVRRIDAAKDRVRQLSFSNSSLVIGYSALADSEGFLEAIERFRQKYPDVSIKLVRKDMTLSLFEGLLTGEMDLVYCFDIPPLRSDDIAVKVLGKGTRYAFLPPDHELAGREVLYPEELANETMLIFRHNPNIDSTGLYTYARTLDAYDIESMELMILAHVGIAILPVSNRSRFKRLRLVPMGDTGDESQNQSDLILAKALNGTNPMADKFMELN